MNDSGRRGGWRDECLGAGYAQGECGQGKASVRREGLVFLSRLCRAGEPGGPAVDAADRLSRFRGPIARAARDHAAIQGGARLGPRSRRHLRLPRSTPQTARSEHDPAAEVAGLFDPISPWPASEPATPFFHHGALEPPTWCARVGARKRLLAAQTRRSWVAGSVAGHGGGRERLGFTGPGWQTPPPNRAFGLKASSSEGSMSKKIKR